MATAKSRTATSRYRDGGGAGLGGGAYNDAYLFADPDDCLGYR